MKRAGQRIGPPSAYVALELLLEVVAWVLDHQRLNFFLADAGLAQRRQDVLEDVSRLPVADSLFDLGRQVQAAPKSTRNNVPLARCRLCVRREAHSLKVSIRHQLVCTYERQQ